MKFWRALGLISLLLLVAAASAQEIDKNPANLRLAEVLSAHDYVIADFTQQRTISGLKKPVQSQGCLMLWRGRLVAWQIIAPVQSLQLIPLDGSKRPARPGQGKIPTQLNQLLEHIFSGNQTVLRKSFRLEQQLSEDGRWRLTLTPKAARMARVLTSIEIHGQQAISQLAIVQRTGRIDLQFAAPQTPTQLPAYWQALIEQN